MNANQIKVKLRKHISIITFIAVSVVLWFFPFAVIRYEDGTGTRPMLTLILRRNPDSLGIFATIRGSFEAGYTLGRYRIETEHGEIILRSFSRIQADRYLVLILPPSFRTGRATHNLVVNGIPLSHVSVITFWDNDVMAVNWPDHEAVVSGVTLPVRIGGWGFGHPDGREPPPLRFEGNYPPEDITPADSTLISFPQIQMTWHLIFNDESTWTLRHSDPRPERFILVKFPGEYEFSRYRGITFGSNWGDFISVEYLAGEEE